MLDKLRDWDGKSVSELENLYTDDLDINILIEATTDDKQGIATTWLIKRFLDDNECNTNLSKRIIQLLLKSEIWQIQLHLLQIIGKLVIDKTYIKELHERLKHLIKSQNKFVRAWSYNGLYLLTLIDEKYKSEVYELLDYALVDECASVKARIRKIIKSYEKEKN